MMPVQGYTPNRNLIQIAAGSTDNWDVWYNQTLDLLDEPSILYKITAAENLNKGEVAAILDDGYGAKKAYLATSATYTFGDPMGLATETVTAGNPVHLALAGRVQNNGWSFGSADKFAYLSASGTVTTTTTSVKIGYVVSSTAIYFDPGSSSSSGGQTDTVAGASGITNTGNNVDAVLAPTYGSSANTVCEGNDSRLHTQNTDGATSAASFKINYTGDSARLLTTGLNANRDYTFPDATTKLIGDSADAAITGDHDYSGGTLRAPTNAGVPSGANDEGDIVFDTTNDDLYVGQGSTNWKKINNGGAVALSRMETVEDNIMLNLFRIAINGGLAALGMVDGVVDEFEDETGVDTGASTNEVYDASGDYYDNVSGATTTWSDTLDANETGYPDFSMRQVIPAAAISQNGSVIRIQVEASSSNNLVLDNVSIVERSGSTDDGTATPTELLFSGSSGITLSAGQTAYSDNLAFSLDETKDYLVIFDIASSGNYLRKVITGGSQVYFKSATNSYDQQTVTGFNSAYTTHTFTVIKIEVMVTADMTLIANNTEAEAEPAEGRLVLFIEPIDAITINTDVKGYLSLDDGATYEQVTLSDEGDYETGKTIYAGTEALTSQSDKTMRWKLTTHNSKEIRVHGVGMQWR